MSSQETSDGATAADAPMSTLLRPQIETLSGDEELDDADGLGPFGQVQRRRCQDELRRRAPRAPPE